MESLLRHTGSLTETLADRDRVIGEVITNLNSVLETINNEGDALSGLVSTSATGLGLAEDREAIGESIEDMAALTTATAGLFEHAREPLRGSFAGLGTSRRTSCPAPTIWSGSSSQPRRSSPNWAARPRTGRF